MPPSLILCFVSDFDYVPNHQVCRLLRLRGGGGGQDAGSWEVVEMEGPGEPDQYPGLEGRQANYPVWAPPTTLFRSLAREPVKDLVVNGVSCLLRPLRVELGGKAGKVAFVARDGVVDVAPKQMVLRKKVLVGPS